MKTFLRKFRLCLTALFFTLVVDQITKYFAIGIRLSDPVASKYHIITVFEKIYQSCGVHFFLINVRHYFDMYQLMLRVIILPVIGCYIIYYVLTRNIRTQWVFIGFGMLFGALIGNAFDILYRGYVIDWIGCSFFMNVAELNYAINFADIMAVVAAPLILIGLRKYRRMQSAQTTIHYIATTERPAA